MTSVISVYKDRVTEGIPLCFCGLRCDSLCPLILAEDTSIPTILRVGPITPRLPEIERGIVESYVIHGKAWYSQYREGNQIELSGERCSSSSSPWPRRFLSMIFGTTTRLFFRSQQGFFTLRLICIPGASCRFFSNWRRNISTSVSQSSHRSKAALSLIEPY
ncbi:hypothetical protein PROFUN_16496 [Planoprotostelium fungivorum]|uniref:Uncharacterized protein n=1 Tax=Planoprotostelium fungivorum TaxID=1890364 RepID=A0A2P6MQ89_9EUKA|nr:hypothetical protein PROFUN_16496 [Planoprotostelium fungivorum]